MQFRLGKHIVSTDPLDITLSKALLFMDAYKTTYLPFIDFLETKEFQEMSLNDLHLKQLKTLMQCFALYLETPYEELMQYSVDSDNSSEMSLESVLDVLQSVFNSLASTICTYQPQLKNSSSYIFIHDNQMYAIPYYLTEKTISTQLTTAQLIETLEVRRIINSKKEVSTASYFTQLIYTTSVIARRLDEANYLKQESFPTQQHLINLHIEDRCKLFKNINFRTGLDINFFLTISTIN